MTVNLTATPQVETASMRLHLSASVADYPVLLSENLQGMDAVSAGATADRWTTFGPITWNIQGEYSGLRFMPNGGWPMGSWPAEFYGIRRTITGLKVGQRYLAYIGADSQAGANDVVKVTLGGASVNMTSRAYNNDDGSWPVGEAPGVMPHTPLVLDFTATATSAVLQFTNAGATQQVHFSFKWLRIVPVVAGTLLTQNNFDTDDAGVALYGTAPTGLSATRRYESVGNVAVIYKPTSGVVNLPNTVGLTKTLTGLTIGMKYRLTVAVDAGTTSGTSSAGYPYRLTMTTGDTFAASLGIWGAVEFTATAASHQFRITMRDALTLQPGTEGRLRLGYYRVDTVPSADDAYTLTGITRADNNGTRPVRTYEGADLSNGEFLITDYEPALTGLVQYRATVYNGVTGQSETATVSAQFPPGAFLPGGPTAPDMSFLAPVALPQRQQPVFVIGYTDARESGTSLARVIGRTDLLPTIGRQGLRSGQLEILCGPFYDLAQQIQSIYDASAVVMLRQANHNGLDLYHVATRTSLDIEPEVTPMGRYWRLRVDYTEVAAPNTFLQGSLGWTIAESLERNPTLVASQAEFPTVLALALGPDA